LRLPKDIRDYRVILMDATVATGAAAMMAIRVLLDHDVKQENINLVRIQFLLSLKSISFLSHIS
jgi:uridine kinase